MTQIVMDAKDREVLTSTMLASLYDKFKELFPDTSYDSYHNLMRNLGNDDVNYMYTKEYETTLHLLTIIDKIDDLCKLRAIGDIVSYFDYDFFDTLFNQIILKDEDIIEDLKSFNLMETINLWFDHCDLNEPMMKSIIMMFVEHDRLGKLKDTTMTRILPFFIMVGSFDDPEKLRLMVKTYGFPNFGIKTKDDLDKCPITKLREMVDFIAYAALITSITCMSSQLHVSNPILTDYMKYLLQ